MATNFQIPIRTVGLHEQKAWMEKLHPQFGCKIEKRARGTFIICRGPLRPTPMSGEYRVRIEYQVKHMPRAFVEDPPLERRVCDERIEHTYSDEEVCLFRRDFRSDNFLALTIVPWFLLWLVFYESWLVTGKWQGGGEHPGNGVMPVDGQRIERDRSWHSFAS